MKRVLVVGSDALLREFTASILADIAVEVRTAETIAEVECECRGGEFDLIIMLDIAPFIDGSAPIATLRPPMLRRPSLFVFAWHHSENVVLSLLESGVSQYVTFPINIRRVRRKICEALETTPAPLW